MVCYPPTAMTGLRTDRASDSGFVVLRGNGRPHHIGIGRTLTLTRALICTQDLDIRTINATSELLRNFTLRCWLMKGSISPAVPQCGL